MAGKNKEIKIIAEPQMDPNLCRFVVDRPVYKGLVTCKNKRTAEGSPLLETLFAIDGVREVMISGGTVTVAKSSGDWKKLAGKIGVAIREKLSAGGPLISEEQLNRQMPTDPELKAKVQKILDEAVNPGLGMHGGSVELIDVKGTTVFLTMSGGCQGCASAAYTLRYGIEQILREKAPEITEVVDVTDHSSGRNPYFS